MSPCYNLVLLNNLVAGGDQRVSKYLRTGTAILCWTCSSAWWRCCAEGGWYCRLSRVPHRATPSHSSFPDVLCLPSCCFLPSPPQRRKGQLLPQTAFLGSTDAPSCAECRCLLPSPAWCPAAVLDTVCVHRDQLNIHPIDGCQVVGVFFFFFFYIGSPLPSPWSCRCSSADG